MVFVFLGGMFAYLAAVCILWLFVTSTRHVRVLVSSWRVGMGVRGVLPSTSSSSSSSTVKTESFF